MLLPLLACIVVIEEGPLTLARSVAAPQDGAEQPVRLDDVEVQGRRGAARVAPETELDAAEIDALGAYDIGEVLRRIAERLGPGEQPMVIINGRRAPNASVFNGFPPDALVRAEVLPRDAASLYGGEPGQRVVNLVLQRRFSSWDAQVNGGRPTAGGMTTLGGDVRRSAIAGNDTHQAGVRVLRETALRADERDRVPPGGGAEDGAATLRPHVEAAVANLTLTKMLGDWSGAFSLNGQTRDSRSILRIDGDLADRRRRTDGLSLTAGLSGDLAGWSVQLGLNGQASRTNEDGPAPSRNETRTVAAQVSANRTLFDLPAGAAVANLAGQIRESRSSFDAPSGRRSVTARAGDARASLSLPLSSPVDGSGGGRVLGDVALTLGANLRETDTGGGDGLNAAISWVPRRGIRLNGVWSTTTDSVTEQQRFEPAYAGAPVVVFDFRTGEAVEVVPTLGGNPDLRPPRFDQASLTASLGPFTAWGVAGSLGVQRLEAVDGIGALPALTPDVEAAFPDRFRRDGAGRLIGVDRRPLNIASGLTETLTSSVTFGLPAPAPGRGGPGAATILRVTVNHSLRLRDAISLHPGLPRMDRLAGDGGGVSGQEASLLLDARRGRWGVNAAARWQDGYRIRRASGRDDPGDLILDSLGTVDLKVTLQLNPSPARGADGTQGGAPRRRNAGLQVALEVDNLFDARPAARLGDGRPAPGYDRDAQDSVGRTVRLTLQRRF